MMGSIVYNFRCLRFELLGTGDRDFSRLGATATESWFWQEEKKSYGAIGKHSRKTPAN